MLIMPHMQTMFSLFSFFLRRTIGHAALSPSRLLKIPAHTHTHTHDTYSCIGRRSSLADECESTSRSANPFSGSP